MKILIADDEEMLREDLRYMLENIIPGQEYFFAEEYNGAIDIVKNNNISIAFLDIQMPGKNGLALAEDIKKESPETNIVMVTAYMRYALDALKLFVSGYLLKPVMEEDLRKVLENLRNPVEIGKKKLSVQCFGNFEVFADGKPMAFKRKKEKELLAYLIALKGASASRGEIVATVFEESSSSGRENDYFRIVVSALKKDLSKYGFGDVFIHTSNSYSVDTGLLDCDYYDFLTGKADRSRSYGGEFMRQYSWAEDYVYSLETYYDKDE